MSARSSRLERLCKINVLKSFAKSKRKRLNRSLYLTTLHAFNKHYSELGTTFK